MGMLMAITMMEQEEALRKAQQQEAPAEEELPFTEPEEPEKTEEKKQPVRKAPAKRRRKTVK